MTVRFSPKTGRMRKRSSRPRLSLTDRLASLHQLLQSSSLSRWPLRLTFYCEDVVRVWQKWTAQEFTKLRTSVEVEMKEPSRPPSAGSEAGQDCGTGIYALDVGYSNLKSHVEKSLALLQTAPLCALCSDPLPSDGSMMLVCPQDGCYAAGHLHCFSASFLQEDHNNVVPSEGNCPGCGAKLQWMALIKELSLRTRSPKDVKKILKVKKGRAAATGPSDDEAESECDEDQMVVDAPLKDDWHYISEGPEAEIDDGLLRSDPSPVRVKMKSKTRGFLAMSEPVIEDSDRDEAEVVT